ncbi:MAG: hypothetical protein A2Y62_05385 [Candidatus Fischerbacteria bacterium RBG_13_37_8]|uniref:Uncharacterized protein n=1 Tax=Candidatus Fischerbacteria bacterium RBG_13_37_8 TaxID=1817863 RepID=A0A1F5VXM4_9BACT|nr:MAG: hypothetical protein A2Y62_05385 [Candidatus Fischerbacteria bacterium RBG_13_37_8]
MKKILMLIIAGLVMVQLAYPQSLVDAAKKEKERREKMKQEGKKAKVITNEDLDQMEKGTLGIETGSTEITPAGETSQDTSAEENTTPTSEQPQTASTAESEDTAKIEQIDKQIEQLKNQVADLKNKRAEEQDRINKGAGIFTVNPGEAYRKMREYDQKIQELETQIQSLENQKLGV